MTNSATTNVSAPSPEAFEREWCRRSAARFINDHCQLYDATARAWVPFHLWPAQIEFLDILATHHQVVALKGRQIGFTWAVVARVLWLMLFHPAVTVLLFSKRDDEAIELLDVRLKGMHNRLPVWMQQPSIRNEKHQWELANGSRAMAFPTTGGRSYTASLVLVDEADYVPDLAKLLDAVKPTVDGGGSLVLLSTSDKSQPASAFKKIYRGAVEGTNDFAPVFHPWQSRPDRTPEWYAAQVKYFQGRDGSLDMLMQEFPASAEESLAARSLDKRIAPAWLLRCYQAMKPLADLPPDAPAIPNLEVYSVPYPGQRYVIGADTAEGGPQSNDSAFTLLDRESGEECAALCGHIEPSVFGHYIGLVAKWYHCADVMVERANHGHAVLLALRDFPTINCLWGHDGKVGWLSSGKGKTILYDACADAFRDGDVILHSFATFMQLSSIEGNTLLAPQGELDDRADGAALAIAAIVYSRPSQGRPMTLGARKW